jgi:hypothetical protein
MSLRIACDLDGTVADMDAALQQEARRMFGSDVDLHAAAATPIKSAEDVEAELAADSGTEKAAAAGTGRPLSRPELRQLWTQIRTIENFWTGLSEIEPGAVARFAELATRHRWDVIFVTHRPASAGETTQRQSQRWLQARGFEMPSVFVNGGRGRIAQALSLDAMIDDRPENCLDVVADSSAHPLLVWRRNPESVPLGVSHTRIEVVPSFGVALDRLEELTVERQRQRTLLGRVRNAIGL